MCDSVLIGTARFSCPATTSSPYLYAIPGRSPAGHIYNLSYFPGNNQSASRHIIASARLHSPSRREGFFLETRLPPNYILGNSEGGKGLGHQKSVFNRKPYTLLVDCAKMDRNM